MLGFGPGTKLRFCQCLQNLAMCPQEAPILRKNKYTDEQSVSGRDLAPKVSNGSLGRRHPVGDSARRETEQGSPRMQTSRDA